jgi:sialate O-acetylesterase
MKIATLTRRLLVIATIAVAPAARAEVIPNAVFTDHAVLQRDKPIPVWGLADPGESVTVSLSTDTGTSARVEASTEGRWLAHLPPLPAGGPYTLVIQGKNRVQFKDVLVGEVWICSGQSNMEWPLERSHDADRAISAATNPQLRLFTVKKATATGPLDKVEGKWMECTPDSAKQFSAVAFHFGRALQKALGVPVGLIHTSWGGTPAQAWTSKEGLDAVPDLRHYHAELADRMARYDAAKAKENYEAALKRYEKAAADAKEEGKPAPRKPQPPASPEKSQNSPSTLYNAMIAPLIPYAIRGAIWYQGESNAGRAYEYRTLFTTMIEDWRNRWKEGDFPFLCVQLAPFRKIDDKPSESDWAELREAQFLATRKLPKVGMAVITDVGEENDIHPRKKGPVGERLALLALKMAYGRDVIAMGPVFKKLSVEGNRAVLSFDNVGAGLECRGPKLTGFTVAGADHKFVHAEAEIRGDKIAVWSPHVEKPVAVRFGWANYPVVNLWNKDGLPATPFRTDNWPGITQKEAAASQ